MYHLNTRTMRKTLSMLVAIVVAFSVQAQDIFNHLGAGITAGTNGIGVNVATPLTKWVTVRAGVDIMPSFKGGYDINVNVPTESSYYASKVNVDLSLSRIQGSLIFNINPFPSCGFFVAAGAYFGGNKVVKVKGHSDELAQYGQAASVQISDYEIPFDKNGDVSGGISVKNFRPYIGLGWGRAIPKKLIAFNFEIGAQIHGTPKVYTDFGEVRQYGYADDDLSKVLNNLTVYPVISFRLSGKIF